MPNPYKARGTRMENRDAARLSEETGVHFKRCPLSKPDITNDPDYPLPASSLLRWVFECKDTQVALDPEWLRQAERFAERKGAHSAILYKHPRKRTVGVFLKEEVFAELLRTIRELLENRTGR
jgi:hypothetical protein